MSKYEDIVKTNAEEYYTTGKQNLSDEAFDALVDKIKEDNPDSRVLTTGWGYEVNANGKVKHKYGHIGSLNKVRNWDEIFNAFHFDNKYRNFFDISAKIDGLSAVLYFKNGILDLALTRGNGEYGIDITEKVITILGKNKINDTNFTGAVRGELTMPVYEFEQFKQNHPEAKNSRNSTAGLINGDDITEDYKYIRFCAYSVVGDEFRDYCAYDKYDLIEDVSHWLKNNFDHTAPRKHLILSSKDYEDQLNECKEKWNKIWFIDGVVITDHQLYITENNEVVQNSVAYKFGEEIKVTEIIDIEWNMSKNSAYIPVAIIKPVQLAETTVKRVTCYNAKFVKDNCLGSGAIVTVCKRGEIIPCVMEVIKPAEVADLPTHCGYCNSALEWDSVHLVCNNKFCEQKEDENIKALCTNLAPVDGLGWKTINKCLNDSFYKYHETKVKSLQDLLNLAPIPGITYGQGERGTFNKMLDIIQHGKFTVSQFLLSLNIPGLGKISVKRWEENEYAFELLEYVANSAMKYGDINWVRLEAIIQDKNVAMSLKKEYSGKFNEYYNLLKNRIINKDLKVTEEKGEVVITGSLSIKRTDFEKQLIQYGWTLASNINKNTKFLITNTPNSGTSKNKKADELGVVKITEVDFVNNYMKG